MSAAIQLAPSVATWNRLKDELIRLYSTPSDEAGEPQAEAGIDLALFDTLDGELDLADQIRTLMRLVREQEAFATALDGIIKEQRARKERLCKSAEAIRKAVAEAALEADIKKLPAPDFTLTFGLSQPKVVGEGDPDLLPAEFVRTPKPEINRAAIREALKAGREVPGFSFSNREPCVTVRVT